MQNWEKMTSSKIFDIDRAGNPAKPVCGKAEIVGSEFEAAIGAL